jgi:hypothetical protein
MSNIESTLTDGTAGDGTKDHETKIRSRIGFLGRTFKLTHDYGEIRD